MRMEELQDLINGGENLKVEFKSWIETSGFITKSSLSR